MSPRFASITAGLLARKGEARPWMQDIDKAPPLVFRPEPAVAAPPPTLSITQPPPPALARDRSCAVRMSAQDYERLGILAVKLNTTRHQILKQALAELMTARAQTLSCACLGACARNCS